jgi:hypothetical protein
MSDMEKKLLYRHPVRVMDPWVLSRVVLLLAKRRVLPQLHLHNLLLLLVTLWGQGGEEPRQREFQPCHRIQGRPEVQPRRLPGKRGSLYHRSQGRDRPLRLPGQFNRNLRSTHWKLRMASHIQTQKVRRMMMNTHELPLQHHRQLSLLAKGSSEHHRNRSQPGLRGLPAAAPVGLRLQVHSVFNGWALVQLACTILSCNFKLLHCIPPYEKKCNFSEGGR